MFYTFLTVIIVGYVIYYGYLMISDLVKKDRKTETRAEEEDIDISGEVESFESAKIERQQSNGNSSFEVMPTSAKARNTGAIGIDDLLKHIDDFAENGEFAALRELQTDWEAFDAA